MVLDRFGVLILNPTKAGGREWFSNWDNGHARNFPNGGISVRNADPDDSFADFHSNNNDGEALSIDGLGIATMTGGNPRLYINDPNRAQKWQNVEMTVYYKAGADYVGNNTIHVHCRLAARQEHQDEYLCSASGHGYSFEVKGDGTIQNRKELVHNSSGGYADNKVSATSGAPRNQWIGLKFILRNVAGNVVLQSYRDTTDGVGGGNWIKVNEVTDAGDWAMTDPADISAYNNASSGSGTCVKITPKEARLIDPANSCYLRTDGTTVQFKKFSIREIAPEGISTTPSTDVTYSYSYKFGSQGSGNGQFLNPHDISFDAAGNCFVCDRDRNDVQKFTHTGTYISKFGSAGSGNGQFNVPYAIQHTPDFQFIYVCDRGNNRVQKLDANGNYVSQITSANGKNFNAPEDIIFEPNGTMYICDTGNERIVKLSASHTFILEWGSKGSGDGQFDHPHSSDVGIDGNIYISSGNQGYIQVFSPNGVFLRKFSSPGRGNGQLLTFLEHLDIDTFGRLHIINNNARPIVSVFDCATGNYLTKYGFETEGSANGQFKEPEHVTVDSDGRPFVVDCKNFRIQVFVPSVTAPPQPPQPPAPPTTPGVFTDVFSGQSAGNNIDQEVYSFTTPILARYIKITVDGNTENDHAGIMELDIFGDLHAKPPDVTPEPPVPAGAVGRSLLNKYNIQGTIVVTPTEDMIVGCFADISTGSTAQSNVKNMAALNVDVVIADGDLTYNSNAADLPKLMGSLNSKTYITIGNHDAAEDGSDSLRDDFISLYGYQGNGWKSVTIQYVHFLFLNTQESLSNGSAQHTFAKNDLAAAKNDPNVKWIIVAFHKPIYGINSKHGINENKNFRTLLHPMMEEAGVDFVYSGHNHEYDRTYPLKFNPTDTDGSKPTITTTEKTNYVDPEGIIFIRSGLGGKSQYATGTRDYVINAWNSPYGVHILEFSNGGKNCTGYFYAVDKSKKDMFTITKNF